VRLTPKDLRPGQQIRLKDEYYHCKYGIGTVMSEDEYIRTRNYPLSDGHVGASWVGGTDTPRSAAYQVSTDDIYLVQTMIIRGNELVLVDNNDIT